METLLAISMLTLGNRSSLIRYKLKFAGSVLSMYFCASVYCIVTNQRPGFGAHLLDDHTIVVSREVSSSDPLVGDVTDRPFHIGVISTIL